ncbi:MAG TPA: hypothetical protein VND90_06050 [Terracidiphilus sp.]|nr:hypothetical protein [Terracidiphilus sp.]
MQDQDYFLCSQLVRVSAGRGAQIGNLEEISATRCVVALQHGLPVGTQIRMQCLDCPAAGQMCTECVFRGRVECTEGNSDLGYLLEVKFERRPWNQKKWKPAHMLPLNPTKDGPQPPLMLD